MGEKIPKKILCCALSLLLLASPLFAQSQSEEPVSETQALLQGMQQQEEAAEQDDGAYSSDISPQQRFEDSPTYNVHDYDYKQQVTVGGAVMFCIIIAMVANNNYNPKVPKK